MFPQLPDHIRLQQERHMQQKQVAQRLQQMLLQEEQNLQQGQACTNQQQQQQQEPGAHAAAASALDWRQTGGCGPAAAGNQPEQQAQKELGHHGARGGNQVPEADSDVHAHANFGEQQEHGKAPPSYEESQPALPPVAPCVMIHDPALLHSQKSAAFPLVFVLGFCLAHDHARSACCALARALLLWRRDENQCTCTLICAWSAVGLFLVKRSA